MKMNIKTKQSLFASTKATQIGLFSFLILSANYVSAGPIEDLQPGHWLEVPNTNLSQVYPASIPAETRGNSGPTSIMQAWSGGAYDTKRDRLMVWGGGHQDYGGNELYAFDTNTLAWERITEPSASTPTCENYMPDGQPAITHTYNQIQYSPNTDSFTRVTGGFWGSNCPWDIISQSYEATDIFDIETKTWTRGTQHPSISNSTGLISAVDAATGHIWVHGTYGGGKLFEYNPKKDQWTARSGNRYLEVNATAAIDPERRLMVAVGGYNGQRQILVWDLTQKYGNAYIPTTSGDSILENSSASGFVYDPTIKKFVGWTESSSVYTLDPTTWVWEKVDAAPTNTVIPSTKGRGVNGRFRYIPSKNVYILVNRTTENVYFYKLNSQSINNVPENPGTPSSTENQL
ncbi:MAG: hypothetical protein RRB22_01460 [Gammaproteobacteria bacterium]|nr:hypothetical protein [Gammaproteobacteria bacterium]